MLLQRTGYVCALESSSFNVSQDAGVGTKQGEVQLHFCTCIRMAHPMRMNVKLARDRASRPKL